MILNDHGIPRLLQCLVWFPVLIHFTPGILELEKWWKNVCPCFAWYQTFQESFSGFQLLPPLVIHGHSGSSTSRPGQTSTSTAAHRPPSCHTLVPVWTTVAYAWRLASGLDQTNNGTDKNGQPFVIDLCAWNSRSFQTPPLADSHYGWHIGRSGDLAFLGEDHPAVGHIPNCSPRPVAEMNTWRSGTEYACLETWGMQIATCLFCETMTKQIWRIMILWWNMMKEVTVLQLAWKTWLSGHSFRSRCPDLWRPRRRDLKKFFWFQVLQVLSINPKNIMKYHEIYRKSSCLTFNFGAHSDPPTRNQGTQSAPQLVVEKRALSNGSQAQASHGKATHPVMPTSPVEATRRWLRWIFQVPPWELTRSRCMKCDRSSDILLADVLKIT